jgi:hypothetical protein
MTPVPVSWATAVSLTSTINAASQTKLLQVALASISISLGGFYMHYYIFQILDVKICVQCIHLQMQ